MICIVLNYATLYIVLFYCINFKLSICKKNIDVECKNVNNFTTKMLKRHRKVL